MPTEAIEAARDLARAREDCRHDLMRARHLLSKFLFRKGIVLPERPHGRRPAGNGSAGWIRSPCSGSSRGIPRERGRWSCGAKARRAVERAAGEDMAPAVSALRSSGISTVTAFSMAAEVGTSAASRMHGRSCPSWGSCHRSHRAGRASRGRIDPDGQHPCEDPPRGAAWRHARPLADVCGSHGRCGGRACRCRRGCRAGEPQASQPCCPSERRGKPASVVNAAIARELRGFVSARMAEDDAAAALGRSLTNGSFPEARAWLDGAWGDPERTMRSLRATRQSSTRGTPGGSIGMRYPTRGYRLAVVRRIRPAPRRRRVFPNNIENGPILGADRRSDNHAS